MIYMTDHITDCQRFLKIVFSIRFYPPALLAKGETNTEALYRLMCTLNDILGNFTMSDFDEK